MPPWLASSVTSLPSTSVILYSVLLRNSIVYGSPLRKRSLYRLLPETWPLDRLTRPSSVAGAVRLVWLRLVLSACSKAS
ncbi:hypothetical protein D3C81_1256550 [compost metagenome]